MYQIAEDHDLIIVEDDPYYYLQLNPPKTKHFNHNSATSLLAALPTSLLHLDTSGRVVRLDSTSKILAPGLRASGVTASKAIIEKFVAYTEVSTVAVSGPTQLMLWHLLEATWGHAEFLTWLAELARVYRERLGVLVAACERHLPLGVCSSVAPKCGMFLWVRMELPERYSVDDRLEAEGRVIEQALRNGVQVTKGSLFDTRPEKEGALYLRLTSAAADLSEFDGAVRSLGEAVKDEIGLPPKSSQRKRSLGN